MFRPLVITVATLAALTLSAAPAMAAAPLAPAQTTGGTNTCANPVLAQNTTGWSATGATASRNAATGHVAAQYAFWVFPYSGAATITLPAQAVTAGQQRTFAFDAQIAGSVRAGVEWYNAGNVRISRVDGPAVTGTATSWVRAAVSGTAPAGATRATVVGTGTAQFGTWWKSTACTYTVTGGGSTTTTTAPPTTTTVPPTTTTVPPTTTTVPPTTTTVPPTTTTVPPTTTTVPPTTTTTPPAGPGDGTQAATLLNWGPVVDGDEFTTLNTAKWGLYNSAGHGGNGLRRPSQISVANGVLTIAGTANGTTGGMSMSPGRKYGRWETRMQVPKGDNKYHPVALLWPDAENWPVGGEVDYAETNAAASDVDFFLHYGKDNRTTQESKVVDLTGWHNYAVEWKPTGIRGYVDGVQFFSDTTTSHLPPGPMHQTLQLDWFPNGSTPTTPSQMNVAWVRVYAA